MGETNVEIVRSSFEAFNQREAEQLVALSHPDCEWHPFRAQLEGSSYRGHDGVRRFLRDMEEDWSAFQIDPVRFHEADDRVVVTGQVSARGRGSGVEVDYLAGFIFELGDGRILRIMSYNDPAAALDAAGLS